MTHASSCIRLVSTGTLSAMDFEGESLPVEIEGSSSGFGCIRMKGNSATRSLETPMYILFLLWTFYKDHKNQHLL